MDLMEITKIESLNSDRNWVNWNGFDWSKSKWLNFFVNGKGWSKLISRISTFFNSDQKNL